MLHTYQGEHRQLYGRAKASRAARKHRGFAFASTAEAALHVWIYMCMYVYIYVNNCTHLCIYAHVAYVNLDKENSACTYMYANACMHIYIHTCMIFVWNWVNMITHIYTHIWQNHTKAQAHRNNKERRHSKIHMLILHFRANVHIISTRESIWMYMNKISV